MFVTDGIDDVAVIDEAQMIQNNERGFAWTRVILGKYFSFLFPLPLVYPFSLSGLPAKEIHICGSAIAVDVVKRVVESVGEQIEVKRYERLLPLVTLNGSLGELDCSCIQQYYLNIFRADFYF